MTGAPDSDSLSRLTDSLRRLPDPDSLGRLSDAELVARVKSLAGREREATAQLVAHLAELDTRDVHLRAGHASLFVYCRDVLRLSEHEAYNRIEVARAARRFPVVLERLAEGTVNLTTVRLLAPHLTSDNVHAVLESACGKKKSEIEEIVAGLAPRPDVAPSIRRLPGPSAILLTVPVAPAALPGAVAPATPPGAVAPVAHPVAPAAQPGPVTSGAPPQPRTAPPVPLSPNRYRLQLTIDGETLEKLRLAKDMLRHAIPSGDEAAILDRALTALLADLARKKYAAARQPRRSRATSPGSRHIPAAVKRAVWLRDLGRCAFEGIDGRRCAERAFVEFHHCWPYAAGGKATVENVELQCVRHNDYEARTHPATRSGTSAARRRLGSSRSAARSVPAAAG